MFSQLGSAIGQMFFDFQNSWSNIESFINDMFGFTKSSLNFFFNFLKSISSYFDSLINFIKVYVIELPITLISIFGELPVFVQTGLTVLLYALYVAFIFRIIKLLLPFL